jgi:hypothetical protein
VDETSDAFGSRQAMSRVQPTVIWVYRTSDVEPAFLI